MIDFCLTKSLQCDVETYYTNLQVEWASKANCKQRKGRAGRVSNGRVYRMIPREFYERHLQEFGVPEMQVRKPWACLISLRWVKHHSWGLLAEKPLGPACAADQAAESWGTQEYLGSGFVSSQLGWHRENYHRSEGGRSLLSWYPYSLLTWDSHISDWCLGFPEDRRGQSAWWRTDLFGSGHGWTAMWSSFGSVDDAGSCVWTAGRVHHHQ